MKAIAEIEIQALGTGVSQKQEVAEAIRILDEFGLKKRVRSLGTEVEGELSLVLRALDAIHQNLHELGVQRISSTVKIETRIDHDVELEDAVSSVEGLTQRSTLTSGAGERA